MASVENPRLIDRLVAPFTRFLQLETSGGVVLLIFAAAALIWANSPWASAYQELWDTYAGITVGSWQLKLSLSHWINDGLMGIFFFLVGLEIKREVFDGELSSPKAAILPIVAALGGMIVPAAIYAAFNFGEPTIRGWGIAIATDIAFALGVLKLLGKRVPQSLKLILMALAIVDDLGAVLVIALFYSGPLQIAALGYAAVAWVLMFGLSKAGVKRLLPFLMLALVMWYFFLQSGVHATVAGVLAAMAIPSKAQFTVAALVERARELLTVTPAESEALDEEVALYVGEMAHQVQSPLQRAIEHLHPWVAFFIMPVFALANAGVALAPSEISGALTSKVGLGVLLGLVVGKQLGISLFVWLALRAKITELPDGLTMSQIRAMAWIAGIGFTMSMFINTLAFPDPVHNAQAKIAIIAASLMAGVMGALAFVRLEHAKERAVAEA